jgi:hypothetical protein
MFQNYLDDGHTHPMLFICFKDWIFIGVLIGGRLQHQGFFLQV